MLLITNKQWCFLINAFIYNPFNCKKTFAWF